MYDSLQFNDKLNSFIKGCQDIIDAYMNNSFPTLPRVILSYTGGPKYIRIVRDNSTQQSVYVFIDKTNGNVLFPASWKQPSLKNPRGNIFETDNGLTKMGPYGAAYLK